MRIHKQYLQKWHESRKLRIIALIYDTRNKFVATYGESIGKSIVAIGIKFGDKRILVSRRRRNYDEENILNGELILLRTLGNCDKT
ncbi:hypothetical protein PUN28_012627 [Cardiocondyla obscurior]|uniref:Uncharacterized protein n=1 Tax=Cardiocondyla obscurior TaxID=286306 RepID=A0AAW2FF48_9HYME